MWQIYSNKTKIGAVSYRSPFEKKGKKWSLYRDNFYNRKMKRKLP